MPDSLSLTSCAECPNRCPPAPLPVVQAGGVASAGVIEAILSDMTNRQTGKGSELQRARAGEPFVSPPHHLEWCDYYTLTEHQCRAIAAALRAGDAGPAEAAKRAGFEVKVEAVNGRVLRVYALCVRKNTGRCDGFGKRREGRP